MNHESCWFGWVSPEGRIFPCEYYGHMEQAQKIVKHDFPNCGAQTKNPELFLEQRGWAKVTKNPFGPLTKLHSAILAARMYITRAQAAALAELGFEENNDYKDLFEMSEMRWVA